MTQPRVAIMRYGLKIFSQGVEDHVIEKVPVRIYSPAKTVVDMFYHGRLQKSLYGSEVGLTEAQAMKETLGQRKATPAEIARHAVVDADIWEKLVQPRLEVLTVDA